MRTPWIVLAVLAVAGAACAAPPGTGADAELSTPTPSATARGPVMPDLQGLGSAEAGRRLGDLGLGSTWDSVAVRCDARPGTVVRQSPAPGVDVDGATSVSVAVARIDVDVFRGPCPASGGAETGADAALARQFYRFAADPSLGAPFVAGDVWVGIEDGLVATSVSAARRGQLAAWRLEGEYAEAAGPFSALDVLARSGGWYDVRRGIVGTCPAGAATAPPELAGLPAVSLTPPADVVGACLQWWGVTLFLDHGEIRGVALRLGSP